MAITIIRKSTGRDRIYVEDAAWRFCCRHNINLGGCDSATQAIDCYTVWKDADRRIVRLWQQCLARALNESYNRRLTLAGEYVGVRTDD